MGLSDLIGLFDNEVRQSYVNFATQDGTVHDFGSYLLLYGPFVIGLLLLVIAYQFSAMVVTGVWRAGKGAVAAGRYVVHRGRVAGTGGVAAEPVSPVAPVAARVPATVAPVVAIASTPLAPAAPAPAPAPAAQPATVVALPVQPVGIKRTPARAS